MKIIHANIYHNDTRSFSFGSLCVEDGIIRAVGEVGEVGGEVFDAQGAYVVPGLIDVHTHGRIGLDFVTCEADELGTLAADYARYGVTTVMPTLATAPLGRMYEMTDAINRFEPKPNEADLFGVHWEGRYMNPEKRGAHAPEYLAPPCAAELESEVFRMCRRLHISVALEMEGGSEFADRALAMGATLGLAHTTANYAEAKKWEAKGIRSYTHLYNAMPSLHHRDGGAVCAAFEGDAFAELICDGIHISPEMIRLAYRNKGAERITLISDSIEAAGMADGDYNIAGMPTVVKNGIARTKDNGVLAGSTLSLNTAVNNLIDFCGIPLTEAILCATESPARQVGLFGTVGSIEVGKRADLLFLTNGERLDIDRIMLRGSFLD